MGAIRKGPPGPGTTLGVGPIGGYSRFVAAKFEKRTPRRGGAAR